MEALALGKLQSSQHRKGYQSISDAGLDKNFAATHCPSRRWSAATAKLMCRASPPSVCSSGSDEGGSYLVE